jgi:hypothetical protein
MYYCTETADAPGTSCSPTLRLLAHEAGEHCLAFARRERKGVSRICL